MSSFIERRRFLRWGSVLVVLGVSGCSSEGEGTVTPPASAQGGKKRLDMIQEKSKMPPSKKK
jgi:hypothetical protein